MPHGPPETQGPQGPQGPQQGITDAPQKIHDRDNTKYKSKPIMTKYEFNQLIGLRTMHLSRGAVPFIELPDGYAIKTNLQLREDIAIKEFKEGKIPFMVKRTLPNGQFEYWAVNEMDTCAIRHMLR